MSNTCVSPNKAGEGSGIGSGAVGVGKSSAGKRKHSMVVLTSGAEIDLNDLPPPRPGRPSGKTPQDPAMQEARKRARVLRNRAAAQLSREKKRQHVESLENENAELQAKNAELEQRLTKAETSNLELSSKLDSLAQQLQSLQSLILGGAAPVAAGASTPAAAAAISQAATPGMWSSLPTPMAASPLNQPLAQLGLSPGEAPFSLTSADLSNSIISRTPSSATVAMSATSSSQSPSLGTALSSIPSTNTSTSESTTAATELFPGVARTTTLTSKGLSESARMPLQFSVSLGRKQPGTCSSTSSSTSWRQQVVDTAVQAIVSASATSSPQAVWTIFCALWWTLCQSGGWISRHQASQIARGVLDHPQQARVSKAPRGLAVVASWLAAGTKTARALRRVAGDGPVDQVRALVARLSVAMKAVEGSAKYRRRGRQPGDKSMYTLSQKIS
ncbi:hypothetical protein DL89DRAFT_29091 [Linderina pennispora]|uniref:BZIP domain-containing protein n=1 Tax=Linderina pennispora TaxID=61395 RepID=A0A1Y1W3Z2_9FUNG|nr:uncharacterized protein DL89DRAFT_29091 [Linderina pennispora]ORX68259.1 hypothetical protein DL89DRAFT_29091 [Linderina pennispora]